MVVTGKMHNYMRMYWGKRVLEWSDSPAEVTGPALPLCFRCLRGQDSAFAFVLPLPSRLTQRLCLCASTAFEAEAAPLPCGCPQAYAAVIRLNDKWSLDGRDPNGYMGVAWCFGNHDRPFPADRLVTGTVRPMTR